MAESRRKILFPQVSDEQWNDWKWQVKNRIETLEDLKKYIPLTQEEEEGVSRSLQTLRMAITPYYLTLIDPDNPNDPVLRDQSIAASERSVEWHVAEPSVAAYLRQAVADQDIKNIVILDTPARTR